MFIATDYHFKLRTIFEISHYNTVMQIKKYFYSIEYFLQNFSGIHITHILTRLTHRA
jgi:hypothetical protein